MYGRENLRKKGWNDKYKHRLRGSRKRKWMLVKLSSHAIRWKDWREQMAAALREEGRPQQLAEQAKRMEEESRKQVLHYDTSSEEEGLIQNERQDSSDDEMPRRKREIEG